MLWTPILLILGLVGIIVVVSLLLAREPGEQEGNAGASALDRFLADARGDRQEQQKKAAAQAIPTARPRQRARTVPPRVPAEATPVEPVREPSPPPVISRGPVIILREVTPTPLPPPVRPLPAPPPMRPVVRPVHKLAALLRDRDSVRAAFVLGEILQRRGGLARPDSPCSLPRGNG